MKITNYLRIAGLCLLILASKSTISAQFPESPNNNIAPPPGDSPAPLININPGSPFNNNAAPTPPPGWATPGCLNTPPSADWMNQGTLNVMATGYDSEGVMKQIPLYISYSFNGVNYNINVINAWNPYTENWNLRVDTPAYSTSYYMNGFTYNYYVVLPIGTFYFNL